MKTDNPFEHLNCTFTINESKRAKKISLKIKPPNTVILTVPHGGSAKAALRFATEHQQWVAQKLKVVENKVKTQRSVITSESNFNTKSHAFKFITHDRAEAFIRVHTAETHIHFPKTWGEADNQTQELVRLAIRETYRQEAKEYLPKRIKEVAKISGLSYNKVSIRDSKSRWGSCSGKKNISLSLSLMKLPDSLIDYILLHELCHTVEMNHGPRFHALLDQVCGGKSKILDKEVKQYTIT